MTVRIHDTITADGKKFKRMIKEFKDLEVRVGIQAGLTYPNGTEVAEVAMWNELGTENIPSRPFLRDSVDANGSKINCFLKSMSNEILSGESAEEVLKKIGVFQKGLVQEQIVSGTFVPNSEVTKKLKGSETPLIDTGLMRQSINYVVQKKGESD